MQFWQGEYLLRQGYAQRLHEDTEAHGLLLLTNYRLVFQVQLEHGWLQDQVDLGLDRIGNVLVSSPAYGPPCLQIFSVVGGTQFRVDDPVGWAQHIVNGRAALSAPPRVASPPPPPPPPPPPTGPPPTPPPP